MEHGNWNYSENANSDLGAVSGSLLAVRIEEVLAKYWYDTEYNYIDKSDHKKAEESRARFRKWIDDNTKVFSNKMNKYEIHIGKALNANNLSETIPLQKIIITQEQLAVIEMFASQRKDAELNTIYKLNECEFRILPHLS